MPSSAKERAKSWKCQVVPRPFNKELPHPDSQNAALKKKQTTKPTKNQTYRSHQVPPALFGLIKVSQSPPSTAHFHNQSSCSVFSRPPSQASSSSHRHRGRRRAGIQFHPPAACVAAVVTPVLSPDSLRDGEEFKKKVQLLPS